MSKIYAKLQAIQTALKAPKSQFNKFGGYYYRKAEDILEAVKPLLAENGCILTIEDDLVYLEGRYYIKATATICAVEDGSSVCTTAFAREEAEKKGMDGSQVTGASSSYARKYALNGLLCIDDTADSDTTNVGPAEPAEKPADEAKAPRTRKTSTAPAKAQEAPKKTVITDKNIKRVVDWVCQVPEGLAREERVAKAETAYEWPGNLLQAFHAMVDLTE